jgi:valyl-tRNA synthetase
MEAAGVEPWINADHDCCVPEPDAVTLTAPIEDRWIFSRLNTVAETVNRALESHRFHEAADTLWHFFWHEFCDWYIELKKIKLADETGLNTHWRNMLTVFERSLRLLHPIMPFVTEELWQRLSGSGDGRPPSIALAHYPQTNPDARDLKAEIEIEMLQEIVVAARTLRGDYKQDPKTPLDATIYVTHTAACEIAKAEKDSIQRLANVRIDIRKESGAGLKGAVRSTPEFDLILHLPEADTSAQRGRLQKEIEQFEKLIANSERQLNNEEFMRKAPEKVVGQIREKLADYRAQLEKNRAGLEALG